MKDNVICVIDEVVIEQLPTYANFPEVGSVKKLYITDDSILYRWSPDKSGYIRVGGKDGATAQDLIDAINEVKKAIPTKVSQLENDVGYLSEESDPTVPDWAKANTKPSYTAEEVGALPATTAIPTKLSDLTADSSHRTVTDTEKYRWNNPSKELPNLPEDASKYFVYGLRSRIDPESGSSYTYWEAVGDAPVLRPPERIWIEETE